MSKRLEAVVEISSISDFNVWEVKKEMFSFIRLSKETTELETGTLIAQIAAYNNDRDVHKKPSEITNDLINNECLIVGGGIKIVDGEKAIYPGCCCGLEDWDDWLEISPENFGLWLGHDPSPYIKFLPEKQIYRIRANGGMDEKTSENTTYIDLSIEELKRAVKEVSQDLQDFIVVLKNWADKIVPTQSKQLIETFKTHFHIE